MLLRLLQVGFALLQLRGKLLVSLCALVDCFFQLVEVALQLLNLLFLFSAVCFNPCACFLSFTKLLCESAHGCLQLVSLCFKGSALLLKRCTLLTCRLKPPLCSLEQRCCVVPLLFKRCVCTHQSRSLLFALLKRLCDVCPLQFGLLTPRLERGASLLQRLQAFLCLAQGFLSLLYVLLEGICHKLLLFCSLCERCNFGTCCSKVAVSLLQGLFCRVGTGVQRCHFACNTRCLFLQCHNLRLALCPLVLQALALLLELRNCFTVSCFCF